MKLKYCFLRERTVGNPTNCALFLREAKSKGAMSTDSVYGCSAKKRGVGRKTAPNSSNKVSIRLQEFPH